MCIRQHTSAYVCIFSHAPRCCLARWARKTRILTYLRQHTSAYVSIRQHTSAYFHTHLAVVWRVWHVKQLPVVQIRFLHDIRQHTSAYVSIRQNTSHSCRSSRYAFCTTYVSIRQHTSAFVRIRHTAAGRSDTLSALTYVSIRQHTPAYVSIRQHTSAYLRNGLGGFDDKVLVYGGGRAVGARERLHTSAYVSIRQHTTAYVSC